MATKNRKRNAFARYFTPFGLGQVFDLTMLLAILILLVGMCLLSVTAVLMPIGFSVFIVGAGIGIYRSVKVLTSGINRRSPEFKRAVVSVIVMGLLVIAAVFGILHYFLWM